MKSMHWIGIDDHADKWTIAHFTGREEKPTREFELVPGVAGYRNHQRLQQRIRRVAVDLDVDLRCLVVREQAPASRDRGRAPRSQATARSRTRRSPGAT